MDNNERKIWNSLSLAQQLRIILHVKDVEIILPKGLYAEKANL